MNGILKVREGRRTNLGKLALFGLGLALVLLASVLPGASVSADEPCSICAEASDPVQATYLAPREARASDIARLWGLAEPGATSAVRSDELVHLRGLIAAAASSEAIGLAEDAEIARLWGLAGPGAGSSVRSAELVHLAALLEAAASSDAIRLARDAEIARLWGLAGPGATSAVRSDELVHLRGLIAAAVSSTMEPDCVAC